MQSGTIQIRNKKYPLTYSGEKAEHLAQGYIDTPHIHPYLHVAAQQFARKGTLNSKGGKRYTSAYNNGSHWVIVGLLLQTNFVVICTCFILNTEDFANLKNKGVGKAKFKKAEKVRMHDIHFSPEVEEAATCFGFTVEDLRHTMYQVLNGRPSLNKKR